jgi:hypothetical protein
MMNLGQLKKSVVLIVLACFVGCTHNFNVKPFPIKPNLLPVLNIQKSVQIVNAQDQGKNNIFKSGAGSKWIGDLGQWTEGAVELVKLVLNKQNVTLVHDAGKTLKLAITAGKLKTEFAGIRCVVKLKVEAGNGYTQSYEGNHRNSSPIAEQARRYAGAGAVTKAVTDLLNDRNIIEYLEN